MKWLILLAAVYQAHSASVCEPRKFEGTYGFQLSGNTTISGSPKPVATIGRLVFDGRGSVSGYSSVNFTGLLLGNPVNGSYEAHTDCTITWSLQDDSGAFQHFAGAITPDFLRIQFNQTDPGGASRGVMVKTPQACSQASLMKSYAYTLAGSTTPMLPGESGRKVSSSGTIDLGEAGKFQLTSGALHSPTDGAIQVDADCMTQLQLSLPIGDTITTALVNLRGVLLDGGKEILAIQTDPGATVTARFTARQ